MNKVSWREEMSSDTPDAICVTADSQSIIFNYQVHIDT